MNSTKKIKFIGVLMSEVKSDIQIAREAKMQPINDILAKINVPDESTAFSPMGRHIAKINLEYLDTLKNNRSKTYFSNCNHSYTSW